LHLASPRQQSVSMGNQANLNEKSTARQSLARLIEAFFSATVELRDGCVPPIRISLAISLWHCPHRSQRASDTGRLHSWRTTSQWKSQTVVSPRIAMDYRPQVRDESWMRIKHADEKRAFNFCSSYWLEVTGDRVLLASDFGKFEVSRCAAAACPCSNWTTLGGFDGAFVSAS